MSANTHHNTPMHIPKGLLLSGLGDDTAPHRDTSKSTKAAAQIIRSQLSNIYQKDPTHTTQTVELARAAIADSDGESMLASTENAPDWAAYHSAWQEYYKQYYERYYMDYLHKIKQEFAPQPNDQPKNAPSKEQAMRHIRAQLLAKLRNSARKLRHSQHFVPLVAALSVGIVFLFLQYNRVLFANVEAYVSPGSISPANIIINPITDTSVSPEPRLIIPKINVDVPVNYDTSPDYDSQMKAMENGVAWFGIPGANSKPGQIGNTVVSGHSSNDLIDNGAYKFIFARLEQMSIGDTIYMNYNGVRHIYTITKKEVVKPTEVDKLIYPTDKPILTLITCTPLGTALNRLLVTAEQISPNPNTASAAPVTEPAVNKSEMPGNSPSFFQRLFGTR